VAVSGDTVNAVAVKLDYPPSKLTYVSSAVNSAVWDVTAAQSAGRGTVDIEVAATTPVSGNQLVATVTFTIGASGPIRLSIGDTSIVASATTNTDLLHPSATAQSLSVAPLRPVRLRSDPTLRFTARLSRPATLDITLLGAGGKRLASWRRHAGSGRSTLALPLPPQARHRGHDRLTITAAGSTPATYPVTLTS
jgi:hypothetical protein